MTTANVYPTAANARRGLNLATGNGNNLLGLQPVLPDTRDPNPVDPKRYTTETGRAQPDGSRAFAIQQELR
ncbi:MAG: hypothetical protein WAW17_22925, partial [Rhodococcus sp. (in: high G+C Gram-positive bacteria)]|uniref:hypothetical protein n=1 Tax=Rhodococcus sp. TaxID=1831 RepID=UPI003BAE81E5